MSLLDVINRRSPRTGDLFNWQAWRDESLVRLVSSDIGTSNNKAEFLGEASALGKLKNKYRLLGAGATVAELLFIWIPGALPYAVAIAPIAVVTALMAYTQHAQYLFYKSLTSSLTQHNRKPDANLSADN